MYMLSAWRRHCATCKHQPAVHNERIQNAWYAVLLFESFIAQASSHRWLARRPIPTSLYCQRYATILTGPAATPGDVLKGDRIDPSYSACTKHSSLNAINLSGVYTNVNVCCLCLVSFCPVLNNCCRLYSERINDACARS